MLGSRSQFGVAAIVVIVALRLGIGWHFYKAGTDKLTSGSFNAGPFIRSQAQGPFADWFTWVLPNEDALLDLLVADESKNVESPPLTNVTNKQTTSDEVQPTDDPELAFMEIEKAILDDEEAVNSGYTTEPTRELWEAHLFQVFDYYGFGDVGLEESLKARRIDTKKRRDEFNATRIALRKKVDELREKAAGEEKLSADEQKQLDKVVAEYDEAYKNFRRDERRYKEEERQILQLRFQPLLADGILDRWQKRLKLFILQNEAALGEFFKARERFRSYQHDAEQVEWREVAGRRTQMARIERELKETRAPLQAQLAAIWGGFDRELNALAVADQAYTEVALKDPLPISRPDRETAALKTINAVIPWFDTIVGGLLILGLFTRPAAFAGVAFLGSIMVMNPPWLSTSELTYYQAIELFALLVLLVVGAGRFAGLDFFARCLYFKLKRREKRQVATEPASEWVSESAGVIQAEAVEAAPASTPITSDEQVVDLSDPEPPVESTPANNPENRHEFNT